MRDLIRGQQKHMSDTFAQQRLLMITQNNQPYIVLLPTQTVQVLLV